MNDFFNNLKNEARKEKLSINEKQYMRMALQDAIKRAPVYVSEEVIQVTTRRIKSSYIWFSPQFAMPVVAFLIIGLGTGTAFASQGALPGDALYSIKINVTEPALGALAVSDEAKAQWHAQVAQTRLEEAETLAVSGKLDANTSAQIAANFDEHRSAADALAQKVEDEDPGSGADLEAQFDSSLDAHDAILARVGDNGSTSGQYAQQVAAHVRESGKFTLALASVDIEDSNANDVSNQDSNQGQDNATGTAVVRTMAFSATAPAISTSSASSTTITATATLKAAKSVAPTSGKIQVTASAMSASQTKALLKLQKSAKAALSDAKDAFGDVKQSLDASTTLKINAEFTRLSAVVNATSSTSASLTAALKDATVLKAFLKASKNLKVNFFMRDSGSSNKNSSDQKGKGSDDTTTTATTSAAVTSQSTLSGDIQNHDAGDDNSGSKDQNDSSGKGSGNNEDDSLVNNLLNSF